MTAARRDRVGDHRRAHRLLPRARVFFRLSSLHRGDRAYVRRADGSLVVFRVTAVRLYRKDRFPTATVYGPAAGPQLRLITCGGTFDPAQRSYEANVVVYAVAAGKVA